MSLFNSFDRAQHFGELNTPLSTSVGYLTAAQRKARAVANLGLSGGTIFTQVTPAAKTTSTTLTAAELLGGLITDQGAGGAVALTLPLATDLETALLAAKGGVALAVNDSIQFSVINLSATAADDITMTTNTGWTLVGPMVMIEQVAATGALSVGTFIARRTAANTFTLYRIG